MKTVLAATLTLFTSLVLAQNASAAIQAECEQPAINAAIKYETKSGNACGTAKLGALRLAKKEALSSTTDIETFQVVVNSDCPGGSKYEVVVRNGRTCRLQSVMQIGAD